MCVWCVCNIDAHVQGMEYRCMHMRMLLVCAIIIHVYGLDVDVNLMSIGHSRCPQLTTDAIWKKVSILCLSMCCYSTSRPICQCYGSRKHNLQPVRLSCILLLFRCKGHDVLEGGWTLLLTDWPADQQTNRLTDQLTNWLADQQISWQID